MLWMRTAATAALVLLAVGGSAYAQPTVCSKDNGFCDAGRPQFGGDHNVVFGRGPVDPVVDHVGKDGNKGNDYRNDRGSWVHYGGDSDNDRDHRDRDGKHSHGHGGKHGHGHGGKHGHGHGGEHGHGHGGRGGNHHGGKGGRF